MDKFRERRFRLALLILFVSTAALFMDKINGDVWATIIAGVGLMYSDKVFTAMFRKKGGDDV